MEKPSTCLDQVFLGCTQRECKLDNSLVEDYRKMSNHEFPQELPVNENVTACSNDMAGHAQKCLERCCELGNKNIEQLYEVSTPCIDDQWSK